MRFFPIRLLLVAAIALSLTALALAQIQGTVRNAHGEVEWFVTNKRDITYLKAMRDSKLVDARYRDLLESTPDAIVIINNTGRIVLVNSQAGKLFGFTRA